MDERKPVHQYDAASTYAEALSFDAMFPNIDPVFDTEIPTDPEAGDHGPGHAHAVTAFKAGY